MFMHLKTSFFYLVAPGEQKSSHIIHEFCNMSRCRIEERTWLFLLICQGSRDFHVSAKNKIHKILTYTCTYIILFWSVRYHLLYLTGWMWIRPSGSVQQNRIGQTSEARRLLWSRSAVHDHLGGERAARGIRIGQLGAQNRIRRRLLHR